MNRKPMTRSFEDLTNFEFQQKLLDKTNTVLVDVRTPEEFENARIPGAINIDVMDSSFVERIATLDSGKTYLVYCRSGGRSRHACARMASQALTVFNLSDGIDGWNGQVYS